MELNRWPVRRVTLGSDTVVPGEYCYREGMSLFRDIFQLFPKETPLRASLLPVVS